MRLIILFGSVALGMLFMFYQPVGEIGFLFSDVKLHADTYIYYIMEHVIKILLVIVIWELEKQYRVAISVLLGLEVIDLIDFILTYNTPWLRYVSINTVKTAFFGLAVVYEKHKSNGK